jgi:hypothetical protein
MSKNFQYVSVALIAALLVTNIVAVGSMWQSHKAAEREFELTRSAIVHLNIAIQTQTAALEQGIADLRYDIRHNQ